MPRRKLISSFQKVQNAQDVSDVVGKWKVTMAMCRDVDSNKEAALKLDGVEVTLDEQMDVAWYVPSDVEQLQLFQATSYILEENRIEFLAGPDGNSFEFQITQRDGTSLVLQSDLEEQQFITIRITKATEGCKTDVAFSLMDALDEGYFSDLKVRSNGGVERMVHKSVLSVCCVGLTYRDWEMMLGSLNAEAFEAMLRFIYGGGLPNSLTLEAAEEILTVTTTNPKLAQLHELCKTIMESRSLKLYITQVVDSILASVENVHKMVEHLDMSDLAKVHYTIKQVVREAVVAGTRLVLLCELYSRNKKLMSKAERKEILDYVKDQLSPSVEAVERLLAVVLAKWNTLSEEQKTEAVQYFIPELEHLWDLFNENIAPIEDILSSKLSAVNPVQKDMKLLLFMNRGKEMKKLRAILKIAKDLITKSKERREEFQELSVKNRVDKILIYLNEFADEGDKAAKKLQILKTRTGSALEWWKYKLTVDFIRSRVAWGVSKLLALKSALKPPLLRVCKFVKRQDLNEAVVLLNLLETSDLSAVEVETETQQISQLPCHTSSTGPAPEDNALVSGCSKLLDSQQYSDMCFVLRSTSGNTEPVIIHSHRVVVAARCEWFKRALLSGMKEAIDKKIEVLDTEEDTFRKFLNFLYGVSISLEGLDLEEVSELLVLGDRYEVGTLRSLCESELLNRLGNTNVFSLLEMADQFSMVSFKEACFHYIVCNPDVIFTEVEGYAAISEELKENLQDHLLANDPRLLLQHSTNPAEQTPPPTPPQSPPSTSPLGDMHPVVPMLEWRRVGGEEQGEELEEEGLGMSAALVQLKDIVGSDANEDILKNLLLAADMDVNRAVNFYFTTMS